MIEKETVMVWDEEKQGYVHTEVILVQCFGLKNIPGKVIDGFRYKTAEASSEREELDVHRMKQVEIWDEKHENVKKFHVVDYLAPCPAEGCNKLMHVQALAGVVHMACCSQECYDKYWRSFGGNIIIWSGI